MNFECFINFISNNKESVLEYLKECKNEGNYDIDLDRFAEQDIVINDICISIYGKCSDQKGRNRNKGNTATLTKIVTNNEEFYHIDIYESLSDKLKKYYINYYLYYIDIIKFFEQVTNHKLNMNDQIISNTSRFIAAGKKELLDKSEDETTDLLEQILIIKEKLVQLKYEKHEKETEVIKPIINKVYYSNQKTR